MFKQISFRLGMSGNLYLGICLGVIISGFILACLLLLTSPGAILGIIVAMTLIVAGLLVMILILFIQEKLRKSPDTLCTCRYRSSVYTLCRECALKEKNLVPPLDTDE